MELLTIADGTPDRIDVWDVRNDWPWTNPSGGFSPGAPRCIIVHHTATPSLPVALADQVHKMHDVARTAKYGLPYNFVVFPGSTQRIFYVNDVDGTYPHTLSFNDCCAVAAWGNYEERPPPPTIPRRIEQLVRALKNMWQTDIPVIAHRHVFATACPGRHLFGVLDERGVFDLGYPWLAGRA